MKSKRNYSIAGCALLAALFQQSAMAAYVNFENESPINPDPTLITVGNTYTNNGISFTSTETMKLVAVGPNPTSGFVPNDTPGSTATGPANFGQTFLTGDFNNNTDMTLNFAAAQGISFQIVDIDGGNDSIVGDANEENFVFNFLLANVLQGTVTINSRDVTGDAFVSQVFFAGLLDEVQIVGTTPGGTRNIGWGIDNITTEVPVPAAAWLFGSGLIALAGLKRRKG